MDSLDKSTASVTVGSLTEKEDNKLSDEEEEEAREAASKGSPFMKVKTTSQPKKNVNNSEILDFLKSDSSKRDKQSVDLLKFLRKKAKKDDKRKRSFLAVLQDIAGKKKED